MLSREAFFVGFDIFLGHIGIVKQTQPNLDGKNAAYGLVDHIHRHGAIFDFRFEEVLIDVGAHVHVHAGLRSLHTRIPVVFGDPMGYALTDGVCIADNEAFQTHLAFEDIPQQPPVDGAGNAVEIVEGGHDSRRTLFHRRTEGRKVNVIQI